MKTGSSSFKPDLFESKLLRAIWRLNRVSADKLAGTRMEDALTPILIEARISHEAGDVGRIEDEYRLNDKMRVILTYRAQQIAESVGR